eukprot:comp13592_c0_seq1/m.18948 comp13592_c0_seq1/g.18948  ORF comp13592_c0_seq1/g.18948 comp13592_c0_seq1/m.18948 type:complete len:321 (+) comp13592_c0_seq1:88-1050(+)
MFSNRLARGFSVLVVAEQAAGKPNLNVLSAITAAAQLGKPVTCLVAGKDASAAANSLKTVAGVDKVIAVNHESFENPLAESFSPLIQNVAKSVNATHIVAASSAFSRQTLPHVAAQLNVQPIADVTAVKSADTFQRTMYAGNVIATVKSTDAVKVITARPTSFNPAASTGGNAAVETVNATADNKVSKWAGAQVQKSDKPDLATAKIVVSGGRGLGKGENFAILDKLASKMNAAVGASRAAVDAGWVPNDMQIGQTGKIVAPQLYIAVGISGAIQHLAGMKDSKVIACINKDPEAPIFQVADYGLVGDLFTAVPELTNKL